MNRQKIVFVTCIVLVIVAVGVTWHALAPVSSAKNVNVAAVKEQLVVVAFFFLSATYAIIDAVRHPARLRADDDYEDEDYYEYR